MVVISLRFKQQIRGTDSPRTLTLDTDINRGECIETKLSRKPTAVKKNSPPLAKWLISPDRAIPGHCICNQI